MANERSTTGARPAPGERIAPGAGRHGGPEAGPRTEPTWTEREAGEVRETAREAGHEMKRTAREAGREVKRTAREVADERKHWIAERGERIAEALRRAGETLDGADEPRMGRVAFRAADRVERWGDQLERRDTERLVRDLESLGREHTGLFMAGAFVAGVAAGRFLRASPDSAGDGGSSWMEGEPASEREVAS